jgi:hypothetical protein
MCTSMQSWLHATWFRQKIGEACMLCVPLQVGVQASVLLGTASSSITETVVYERLAQVRRGGGGGERTGGPKQASKHAAGGAWSKEQRHCSHPN